MKELRVALYARVSSEQQAEAGTIDSQIVALRERIIQDGYRLEEELAFVDDGYSGTTLIRPLAVRSTKPSCSKRTNASRTGLRLVR